MNITADGDYHINANIGLSKSVVYLTGTAGGATFTLKVQGVALTDGVITADSQTQVNHGKDQRLMLNVTGGSGTDVNVSVSGVS